MSTLFQENVDFSTQESANLLNVSCPFLIKLLENGEIPFHQKGVHRRIWLADLLQYKVHTNNVSYNALELLVEQAQELDMGY